MLASAPVSLALAALVVSSGCKPSSSEGSAGGATVHSFDPARIPESSGMVRSRTHPGVFWTHSDSGREASLYAISSEGRWIGKQRVEGGTSVDWEDITLDDAGHLYIADTGNNANARRDLAIHRMAEPDPKKDGGSVRVDRTYRFRYADQTSFPDPVRMHFDAEAMFWARGALYLLTKERGSYRTRLFRIPEEAVDHEVAIEPIGSFDVGGRDKRYGGMVSGADATEDGQLLAVLTYHALFVFGRPETGDDYLSRPLNRVDLDQDQLQQTESVAWDGWSLLLGNEDGKLFRVGDPFDAKRARFP